MQDPALGAISTFTVGFMGESLTALLLELEFGNKGLRVIKIGQEDIEWDLFIFKPAKGTPFTRPTAIQVKTRSRDSWWTYPSRSDFLKTKKGIEGLGYDLWYCFIHYRYAPGHLKFGAYLVPASDIVEGDFATKREFGREEELLKINTMRDRARLKFSSRSMDIENEMGTQAQTKSPPIPLGVSTDIAGDWGEDMAAFMLDSEYKAQALKVAYIGKGHWPYDLFIDAPVDDTPFSRQGAISVKANTQDSNLSKPSFEEMSKARSALDAKGIDLWICLIQSYYTKRALGFGIYLIDSTALDRTDFVDVPGSWQRPDLLSFVSARKKATVRLWTEEPPKKRGLGPPDL